MTTSERTTIRSILISDMVVAIRKNPPEGATKREIEDLESEHGFRILAMNDLELEVAYRVRNIANT